MRNLLLPFLILLMCSTVHAASDGNSLMEGIRAFDKMDRGEDLNQSEAISWSYFMGLARGISFTGSTSDYFCFPDGFTGWQGLAVVSKWARDNPKYWHEPDVALVTRALAQAYPCPKE